GRWNRRAYAYFLVKSTRSMSELSRKRLNALAESSGYGGGMKVAMRDLEIRGAGDILGYEQSGHVSSIGFHLYCKLLKRTIQTLQGKLPSVISDTKIDMPIDARLPERYIPEISIRMEIYQRLGEALSTAEIDAIFAELKDRFGKLPREVEWLNRFTRIRVFASLNGFNLLKIERNILIAEQQKGDGVVIKKSVFKIPSNPEEFEKRLIEILKKEFRITKLL
ncbi:MAG: TRCF domain-containing protein, partial [Parachlamydiaceae bacterium]